MAATSGHRGATAVLLALALAQAVPALQADEPYWRLDQSTCGAEPCEPKPMPPVPRFPWYVQSEGLVMRRDVHGTTDVAAVGSLPAGTTPTTVVFSTADLNDPFAGGAKVLVGHTFADSPLQVEMSYFALTETRSDASIRDTTMNSYGLEGNLFSPFTNFGVPAGVEGVDFNNTVSIREFSKLDHGELNLVWLLPALPSRLTSSALIGARYVKIKEQFDYSSWSGVPTPAGATNTVETHTRNELWGPQIGALFQVYIEDRWWVDVAIKGALCNNSASQETWYTNVNNGVSHAYHQQHSRDVTTYVGDLDLTLVYRCSPGFTTRIGYQAIWIDGLAIASRNFDPTLGYLTSGPGWLDSSGKAVYHGVHAGIEFAW